MEAVRAALEVSPMMMIVANTTATATAPVAADEPGSAKIEDEGGDTLNAASGDDFKDGTGNSPTASNSMGGGVSGVSGGVIAGNIDFGPSASSPPIADGDIPNDPGKMFIGGLSWQTTPESIREYFSMFGELTEVMVMKDPATRRSRGFGFITFSDPSAVDKVLSFPLHQLDGKMVEPKVAVPRKTNPNLFMRTKKIFVGGLSATTSLEDVKEYFEQFSKVRDAMLAYDKVTNRHRGFGFVTFDNDEVVDKICEIHFHEINGECSPTLPLQLIKTNFLSFCFFCVCFLQEKWWRARRRCRRNLVAQTCTRLTGSWVSGAWAALSTLLITITKVLILLSSTMEEEAMEEKEVGGLTSLEEAFTVAAATTVSHQEEEGEVMTAPTTSTRTSIIFITRVALLAHRTTDNRGAGTSTEATLLTSTMGGASTTATRRQDEVLVSETTACTARRTTTVTRDSSIRWQTRS